MREIFYSPAAATDLDEIVDYIAKQNAAAARKLANQIEAAIESLAAQPGLGHQRRDISDPGYRTWIVKPYAVVYRYDDQRLTVVRVIHGRRDFRTLFD